MDVLIDLTEEDLYDIHSPICVGEKLSNELIVQSLNTNITFSFANCDLGNTDYGFDQEFTDKDTRRLFMLLKEFSETSLQGMIDVKDQKDEEGERLHLNRNNISGKLKEILQAFSGADIDDNTIIYHFALYTDNSGASSRVKGIRSPRIYFMVGQYGIMHILFFDPYHEINP